MDDETRQIVEQNAALIFATADLNARLVLRLVNFGALSKAQALATLSDLAGHAKESGEKNEQFPGMQAAFQNLANRLQMHVDSFRKETGTTWEAAREAVEKGNR